MQDDTTQQTPTARGTRTALKIALVGAGVIAGAIGASAIGANASTNSTTAGTGSTSSAYTASGSNTAPSGAPSGAPANGPAGSGYGHGGPGGPGGPGGQNPNETVIASSDSKYKTLVDAAKAAVPAATVDKVETDSGDAKYEVHMTKSDGSRVTVKFDANLKQTGVEDGMGK